jgi:hypothetical protein
MATILLDRSVIFDHLNGRYGRTEFLDQLVEQGHVLACCPVNVTEVYAGIRPGEEATTEAFIGSQHCLRFCSSRNRSARRPRGSSETVAPKVLKLLNWVSDLSPPRKPVRREWGTSRKKTRFGS